VRPDGITSIGKRNDGEVFQAHSTDAVFDWCARSTLIESFGLRRRHAEASVRPQALCKLTDAFPDKLRGLNLWTMPTSGHDAKLSW